MALAKTAQDVLASQSNSAGGTTTSAAFACGYGVSILATITNGATGPTLPCAAIVEVRKSGGTFREWRRATQYDLTASAVNLLPINLGLGGEGADFDEYRVKMTGNTVQAVTVQVDAEATTGI